MIRISMPILFLSALLLSGCNANPFAWWAKVNTKAGQILSLEAKHEALERDFEKLKKENYRLESELAELKSQGESRDLAKLNLEATGSPTGRRLAAITYVVPTGLKPEEVQALAFEHFREKRFAEAAVSFEEFLTQPESAVLQDANSLYSAGVAWFQVGNFKKAREHLESARAGASGEQKDKIRRKVDLWMRVIDRKLASDVSEAAPRPALPDSAKDHAPESHDAPAEHDHHGG